MPGNGRERGLKKKLNTRPDEEAEEIAEFKEKERHGGSAKEEKPRAAKNVFRGENIKTVLKTVAALTVAASMGAFCLIGYRELRSIQQKCAAIKYLMEMYVIETDEICVANYDNMEFVPTEAETPTQETLDEYVQYMLSLYNEETGSEEEGITQDVLDWISEGMTEEELYDSVAEQFEEYYTEKAKETDFDQIYSYLIQNSYLKDYSEEELKEEKESEREYIETYVSYHDLDLDEYIVDALECYSDEEYEEYLEECALEAVKADKIIKAIAVENQIEITDEEYQAYIDEIMETYGYESEEDLMEVYEEEELKEDLLYEKVLEFVWNELMTGIEAEESDGE